MPIDYNGTPIRRAIPHPNRRARAPRKARLTRAERLRALRVEEPDATKGDVRAIDRAAARRARRSTT